MGPPSALFTTGCKNRSQIRNNMPGYLPRRGGCQMMMGPIWSYKHCRIDSLPASLPHPQMHIRNRSTSLSEPRGSPWNIPQVRQGNLEGIVQFSGPKTAPLDEFWIRGLPPLLRISLERFRSTG
eukprot:270824-Pyramimonas_sp.AAC.2